MRERHPLPLAHHQTLAKLPTYLAAPSPAQRKADASAAPKAQQPAPDLEQTYATAATSAHFDANCSLKAYAFVRGIPLLRAKNHLDNTNFIAV